MEVVEWGLCHDFWRIFTLTFMGIRPKIAPATNSNTKRKKMGAVKLEKRAGVKCLDYSPAL